MQIYILAGVDENKKGRIGAGWTKIRGAQNKRGLKLKGAKIKGSKVVQISGTMNESDTKELLIFGIILVILYISVYGGTRFMSSVPRIRNFGTNNVTRPIFL